jgi:high-affinity nickel-transport protein
MKGKIIRLLALLVAGNLGAWLLAILAFGARPALLGTALLAYTFGLRHAVDADHISAIDNVTRKLMNEGRKPLMVGLFFSLGHATIVVLLSAAIALGAGYVRTSLPQFEAVGGIVGTAVSAGFLFAVAAINLAVLSDVVRAWRRSRGGAIDDAAVDALLAQRGFMSRLVAPFVRSVDASVKMYPLGVLFGLGFDTATEVGLLGIAALEAGQGVPPIAIMIFPLLFAAGMCLIDTADGMLMLGAYGWALVKPAAKLGYNIVVTGISVVVAVAIGTIELLGVAGDRFGLHGAFWDVIARTGDHFGTIGAAIVAAFALVWLASIVRARRASADPHPIFSRR